MGVGLHTLARALRPGLTQRAVTSQDLFPVNLGNRATRMSTPRDSNEFLSRPVRMRVTSYVLSIMLTTSPVSI